MSSTINEAAPVKQEVADIKVEPKEEVFVINEEVEDSPVELQTILPLKLDIPVNKISSIEVEPRPSTSRAVLAKVVCHQNRPLTQPFKYDLFDLAPRARFSPPPPPTDQVKRRSIPGGHASATPKVKFSPYQVRR